MRRTVAFVLAMLVLSTAPAAAQVPPDEASLGGVAVPPGYQARAIATGLDQPDGIAFEEGGPRVWVSEAGYTPGSLATVKAVAADGSTEIVLEPGDLPAGTLAPPFVDVTWHEGMLYLTHLQRGANDWLVGAISRFAPDDPAGTFTTVLTNLPSTGDHATNEIVFDVEGRAYFGQGTATNTSVVGPDNAAAGWLELAPTFREFAAVDLELDGDEYTSPDPRTSDPADTAVTAPYRPFGSGPIEPGTVIPAATPSTPQEGMIAGGGAVYSFDPDATDPASTMRLEKWGLRNPVGVGLDPFEPGTMFVSNNGSDVRSGMVEGEIRQVGSRGVSRDHDDLFAFEVGGEAEFAGWPDYFHDPETNEVLPVTDPLFCSDPLSAGQCPDFVLSESFRAQLDVAQAFATLGDHSAATKFDISTSGDFGYVGDLFVTESGSFPPQTGTREFTGYKVVRVDRETGEVFDFFVNQGSTPEELFDPASFNKPLDVKFHQGELYVVDFGIFEPGLDIIQPNTGKIWVLSPLPPLEELALEGEDPVDAAVAFSQATFPQGASQAVLGRDDVFADNLASGSLQGAGGGAPLLLTDTDELSAATAAELQRLEVEQVTILGGIQAISAAVRDQLEGMGYTVGRLSGPTRVETAIEIAQGRFASSEAAIVARAYPSGGDMTTAFADSLAGGAAGANAGVPILFTDQAALSPSTRDYLDGDSMVAKVIIKGGTHAVSAAVEQELVGLGIEVIREAGATRDATAVEVARIAFGYPDVDDAPGVILVDGFREDSWAAGFPAAAMAAQRGFPVLLADGGGLPAATQEYLATSAGTGATALVCGPFTEAAACDAAAGLLGHRRAEAAYRVTIANLTGGQPFSPPVAASHQPGLHVFQVGAVASPQLEAIAEDGMPAPMAKLLAESDQVTDVAVGMPLTPMGITRGMFSEQIMLELTARPGDVFSIATMLICTNDGFLGLDGVTLPDSGSATFDVVGYDAGTEDNTELSEHLVDPCSGLGPVPLPGDPDSNVNEAVDTDPHMPIAPHGNVQGVGDLDPGTHGWTDPVAQVVIERLG